MWEPTCNLRIAVWDYGDQKIERLQQEWINVDTQETEWRQVIRYQMALGEPYATR
jgi:hypothetical protein